MTEMKTVYLEEIKNPREKDVIVLLNTKGSCLYGNIIQQLSISAREGQHVIYSLLSRGLIKYRFRSSNIELNVKIK